MLNTEIKVDISDMNNVISSTTSKGDQLKYTNGINWIKLDKFGYEGLAEEFASRLLEASNLRTDEYIKYQKCKVYEGVRLIGGGYVSRNFLSSDETLITFARILEFSGVRTNELNKLNRGGELVNKVLSVIKNTTELDVEEYLSKILTLDAIILNEDRHLNNLALIYNTDTGKYRTAPIFDNGLSLLSDINDYPYSTPTDVNIRRVKARPFKRSFDKQMKLFDKQYLSFDRNKVDCLIEDYRGHRVSEVLRINT